MKKPDENATEIDSFICPSCSVKVVVARGGNGQDFLAHPMPMCSLFEELPPEEFAALALANNPGGIGRA